MLRELKNHLTLCRNFGRRPDARRPVSIPTVVTCPVGFYDCYFDYANADPSVCVDVYEVMEEPRVVSSVSTGYIEHSPEQISQILAMPAPSQPLEPSRCSALPCSPWPF